MKEKNGLSLKPPSKLVSEYDLKSIDSKGGSDLTKLR